MRCSDSMPGGELAHRSRALIDLSGRVAIITGGGHGIGRAIVKALAEAGADVAVADIDWEAAEVVVAEICAQGTRALAVPADISMEPDAQVMVARVVEKFGQVDILVNNAGIGRSVPFEEITLDEWQRVLSVNLTGVFLCTRAVVSVMKPRRWGRVVNLGSMAGKTGGATMGAHYAVTKAGVMCLTKHFARVLGPFGITVNAVAPGVIDTRLTRGVPGFDGRARSSALGRWGAPEEVARAVRFLASEEASYVTGEILDVDGGTLMD